MPETYTVSARASGVYRCFVIPTRFAEDRWVTKVEYAPGDRKLVHHILSYIDTTPAAEALDRADPGPGYSCFGGPGFTPAGGLSGWAPGNQPRVTAEGVGMLLPKGANVVLQMHYNNDATEARTDRTRVGLHFAKSPIDKRQRGIAVLNRTFTIPPGARRYEVRASLDGSAGAATSTPITITPHMHLLGREMKVTATYPDGTVRPLDLHRRLGLQLAGQRTRSRSRSRCRAARASTWSRSSTTPPRTSVSRAVRRAPVSWGEGTTDEMAIVFIGVTVDGERIGWRPPAK